MKLDPRIHRLVTVRSYRQPSMATDLLDLSAVSTAEIHRRLQDGVPVGKSQKIESVADAMQQVEHLSLGERIGLATHLGKPQINLRFVKTVTPLLEKQWENLRNLISTAESDLCEKQNQRVYQEFSKEEWAVLTSLLRNCDYDDRIHPRENLEQWMDATADLYKAVLQNMEEITVYHGRLKKELESYRERQERLGDEDMSEDVVPQAEAFKEFILAEAEAALVEVDQFLQSKGKTALCEMSVADWQQALAEDMAKCESGSKQVIAGKSDRNPGSWIVKLVHSIYYSDICKPKSLTEMGSAYRTYSDLTANCWNLARIRHLSPQVSGEQRKLLKRLESEYKQYPKRMPEFLKNREARHQAGCEALRRHVEQDPLCREALTEHKEQLVDALVADIQKPTQAPGTDIE